MKKLFIAAFLIFGVLSANVSAQKDEKSGKISEMISAANKTGSLVSGLLGGGFPESENAEKGDEIILNLRIIGYYKKGKTIDYFLVADGVK